MHCSLTLYPERRLEGEREMGKLAGPNIQSCSQAQAVGRQGGPEGLGMTGAGVDLPAGGEELLRKWAGHHRGGGRRDPKAR